ncbi:MAG: hypothetical protein K0S46_2219 [Moraxellaceae bacterium]|jgi:hypothetical protein|nr:hypothetical protein [Moraxellaceae bacterium]
MTMNKNLGVPWKKSHSLGDFVKGGIGGAELIAVIYGRTAEERHTRAAVVVAGPRMLHTLKTLLPHLEAQHDGDGGPYWPAELVRAAIAEAEPA